MSEYINTYDLNEPYQVIPMERQSFYDEQIKIYRETGKPNKSVDVVNVILFNESGEMIVQKRASHKRHNPNLLDKSIGGHVNNWDDPNYTVMMETVQELEVPSVVARNHIEFMKTFQLLNTYLTSIAIVEYIGTKTFTMERLFWQEKIVISNRTHFYLWVYGGRVKNLDKEAKWILFYSLEELEREMKEFPAMFTDDLKILVREYKKEIQSFIDRIVNK